MRLTIFEIESIKLAFEQTLCQRFIRNGMKKAIVVDTPDFN